LPEPTPIECDQIYEPVEGALVKITGEVVEKKGSAIYVDDGTDEVEVYIKSGTGINKTSIKEGETITVIGIVSRNKDTFRVLPRSSEDIIKKITTSPSGEVLGEVSVADEWSIGQNNKKLRLMQYLLVFVGGLVVVLGWLLWKQKKKEK